MRLHKFKLLLAIPLMVSCSLTPLYKSDKNSFFETSNNTSKPQIKIKIKSDDSYSVFKLKNILEQKKHILEPLLTENTVLTISMTENYESIGMDSTGSTVRNLGRIAVSFTITPAISDKITKPAQAIKIDSISSYNQEAADEFSNDAAISSTKNRLLIDLSEQIVRETVAFLKR